MEEVASDWGLKPKINQENHEVHIYSGRQYRGTVICRSMESRRPSSASKSAMPWWMSWTC